MFVKGEGQGCGCDCGCGHHGFGCGCGCGALFSSPLTLPPLTVSPLFTFGCRAPAEVKEYLATIERFRAATMDRLVLQYKSIGPLLTKVAVLVGEESAHRLPKYYGVWEKRIFSALTDMVLKNLRLATHLMHNSSSPLFRVDVRLSAPELVLVPSAGELYRMLRRMFRSLLDSLKGFYRWQHGTCVLTKELVVEGEDTPVVFSFYDDVSVHPQVVAEINEVERVIKEMFDAIAAYLSRWKRYSALWKLDKSGSVTKFAAKNPSITAPDSPLLPIL